MNSSAPSSTTAVQHPPEATPSITDREIEQESFGSENERPGSDGEQCTTIMTVAVYYYNDCSSVLL